MSPKKKHELCEEYFNIALQMHKMGKLVEAKSKYAQVLEIVPNHFDSLYLVGMIAYKQKEFDLAINYLKQAVKVNSNPDAYFNLGVMYEEISDYKSALQNYSNAIFFKPDYLEALFNRAKIYADDGRIQPSLSDLQEIVRQNAHFPGVQEFILQLTNANKVVLEHRKIESNVRVQNFQDLHKSALDKLNRNQNTEAIPLLDLALKISPHNAEAHHNRGMALEKIGELQGALVSYQNAILYKSDSAESHNNAGNVMRELGMPSKAIEYFEKAILLRPNYPEAFNNLGWTRYCMQEYPKSIECYEMALSLNPNLNSARFNLSLSNLMLGDYLNGWDNYESRMKLPRYQVPKYAGLEWDGKATLENKTILVRSEQGLGDTIQFCRYINSLKELKANIIFQVQPELVALFKNQEWLTDHIFTGGKLPNFDYFVPLMSLPKFFRTTLDNIPNASPYIFPDRDKSVYWGSVLSKFKTPKIGIVWAGGFRKNQPELWGVNQRRNIAPQILGGINLNEVNFFSLQIGGSTDFQWPSSNFHNFTSEIDDFRDTAALIANLDLIISVDTSTAHLAAAMGKPTWILNRFDGCWRWMANKKNSPWYPSVSLYSQKKPGEWKSAIEEMREDLKRFILNK